MLELILSKTVDEGRRSREMEDWKDRKSVEDMKGEKEMEDWKTKFAFFWWHLWSLLLCLGNQTVGLRTGETCRQRLSPVRSPHPLLGPFKGNAGPLAAARALVIL